MSKVQDILKTDTEAFPRRAAVKFLQSFYSYKVKVRELYDVTVVKETLMTSSKDFDWEVKLAGLEFVKNLISQETDNSIDNCEDSVPSYAVDLVKRQKVDTSEVKVGNLLCAVCRLELYGCWKALLQAVDDYDQTVCEAADKILLDFSQTLKTVVMDTKANGSKMEEIWEVLERHLEKLEKDGIGLGFQQDKEKFSNFNHSSLLLLKPTISKESKLNSKNNELNGHDCESFSGVDFLKLGDSSEFKAEILKLIKKLMRYEAGVKVSGKTDYETNPFSLLDDILSYARKDEESNVVDCY